MFLVNSRSHLVTSTPQSSSRIDLHLKGRTFSRSYGAILPSSFTRVLSSALVFSTRPPVSVYSTVLSCLKLRDFSWKQGISYFSLDCSKPRHHASVLMQSRICLRPPPTRLNQHPSAGQPSLLRHPIAA